MAGESARESARRQREKAERLQRSAELWERGADGEQLTAGVLGALPIEWTVFHDMHWPGRQFANVDHIVVGPPGVFVVDSKNWSGTVEIKNDVLRQNSRKREREVAAAAESAIAVGQLVPALPNRLVHPVLCFAGDRQLSGRAHDVLVTSTDTVVSMLVSRPPVLTPAELTRVRLALTATLRPARGREPARRPMFAQPSVSPKTRSPRRKKSKIGDLIRPLLVLVAILVFLYVPGVRTAVTDAVTGFMTDTTSESPGPATNDKKHAPRHRHQHSKSRK